MDVIKELLKDVPLPKMATISQSFPSDRLTDVAGALRKELNKSNIIERVRPGMRIAVAVGSRGLADLPVLVQGIVSELKRLGAKPFVIPAMGSHGGASAEGQEDVLANLGVTPESVGCPIVSSMEVVEIGRLANGLPVYMDKQAYEADGIVVLNRVKPHTAFRGNNESGIVKMLTIGLGKQKGAEACHAYSFKYMAEHIVLMAEQILATNKILFGIATVENAYDQISKVAAAAPEEFIELDRQLLVEAKANMASLPFKQIDVLVLDRIGKDISGDGMDPNITGRYPTPYASGGPEIAKMVVLDLTERTHGNANGMGTADFATRRLVNKTNFSMTYANGLTSTVVGPTHMPTILECDQDALLAAIKTCNAKDQKQARIVRIADTLHLGKLQISEALVEEALKLPGITLLSEPAELSFDEAGNLLDLGLQD
ncbi:lactate racemase domain-containing protein [Anaerospora hongkongensis]|uniref:lactate racemase domain-containing protein n=1 Tax=Anaerospora hongkongensis TaxID=244830 RepID=UPI00289D3AA1|nr:lactate racemase domain-containing protein [Anaerospora hongkongensis]